MSFWWYHPSVTLLRKFAVYIDSSNVVIHAFTVIEFKFALEIDFNESASVRFLRFEELVPAEPTSMLAIEQHVNAPADCPGKPRAIRIISQDAFSYGFQASVIGGFNSWQERRLLRIKLVMRHPGDLTVEHNPGKPPVMCSAPPENAVS
jgi:hypothetical protein